MRSIPTCSVADVAAAIRTSGLTLSETVERAMTLAGRDHVERLYAGSNFCSKYFLNQPQGLWREAFSLCRSERIAATLVIPVVPQRDLFGVCRLMDELLDSYGDVIDEITVNDVGMLAYCRECCGRSLNLGRLFFKEPRDPRFPSLFGKCHAVSVPAVLSSIFPDGSDPLYAQGGVDGSGGFDASSEFASCVVPAGFRYVSSAFGSPERRAFARGGSVVGIELDPTHAALDLSELRGLFPQVNVGVHMPYCYLSTGGICELAGIGQAVGAKFRPHAPCAMECAHCLVEYDFPQGMSMIKWGRAVYFPNHECVVHEGEDFRMIVTPFDVLLPMRGSKASCSRTQAKGGGE